MTDILDIEGIIRFPWKEIFFWVFFLLGTLLLSYLTYRVYQIIKNRKKINPEDLLSPAERFFLETGRLQQQQFLKNGEFKKYIFFLSEIFRRYLEERFGYPALDKTTAEFLNDIRSQTGLPSEINVLNESLFQLIDQIKFADFSTDSKTVGELTVNLSYFVRQTAEKNKEGP